MYSHESRHLIYDTKVSCNLDLLRAIAVLCVFVSHLAGGFGYRNLGSLGRFGVIVFFVHTSFVLMASLARLEPASKTKASMVQAFWIRRIFRIYPLAIVVILAMALFRVPASPGLTYKWIGMKAFCSNLALTQNLTYSPDILDPLWSLPLEVQMYVLLPFAYLLLSKRSAWRSAILWVISVGLAMTLPPLSGRLHVFLYAPCFTSGIVAFDLLRARPLVAKTLPAWVWPVGISAAIAGFRPLDDVSLVEKIHSAWFLSLGLGLLYAYVKEVGPYPLQGVVHWIAEHSYGIYLSHVPLIWFVFYPMGWLPLWVRMFTLAVSMMLVPAMLYRYIEKPGIALGNRIAGRRRAIVSAVALPV